MSIFDLIQARRLRSKGYGFTGLMASGGEAASALFIVAWPGPSMVVWEFQSRLGGGRGRRSKTTSWMPGISSSSRRRAASLAPVLD